MQTLVDWRHGHVSLCFSYSTWYPNSTVREEAWDHALLANVHEVLCRKRCQLQHWMSPIPCPPASCKQSGNICRKAIHAQCCPKPPTALLLWTKLQGTWGWAHWGEKSSWARDPLLKVVWGCLSKCGGGTSVFCFQMLHCCFLLLVKADSFLP